MVGSDQFATTRWSIVRQAGGATNDDRREALEYLCEKYWMPLYAFARHRTNHTDDAKDLVQSFFVDLIERDLMAAADSQRGKFRAFLITAFRHFASKERDKQRALKRGGGKPIWSLDFELADSKLNVEPATNLTAEQIFDRSWAQTLLELVLANLENELRLDGKAQQYRALKGFIIGDHQESSYAEAALQLRISEGAAKMAAHRMRGRYRELLRKEVSQTVSSPEEVDEEIRSLFAAVAS